MPLTKKGKKILGSFRKQYGTKKGTEYFYRSINKGIITGAERGRAGKAKVRAAVTKRP